MSDILIKGMEMPTSCYDCPLAMQYYVTLFGKTFKQTKNAYACVLTHKKITSTRRNRFCPFVELPPHGRLIDADAILEHRFVGVVGEKEKSSYMVGWNSALEAVVENAETILGGE